MSGAAHHCGVRIHRTSLILGLGTELVVAVLPIPEDLRLPAFFIGAALVIYALLDWVLPESRRGAALKQIFSSISANDAIDYLRTASEWGAAHGLPTDDFGGGRIAASKELVQAAADGKITFRGIRQGANFRGFGRYESVPAAYWVNAGINIQECYNPGEKELSSQIEAIGCDTPLFDRLRTNSGTLKSVWPPQSLGHRIWRKLTKKD